LQELTRLIEALARHPAVVCYFNPNGEIVLPPERFSELLKWSAEANLPPLQVWSNIRFFNLNGTADGWFFMDTVGMWQLDVPDHEVYLPGKRYSFAEVDGFLRNAALYVLTNGPVIKDGDTMDGPGNVRWQGKTFADSFTEPPREVLRWFPVDGTQPPKEFLSSRPK
jgi:hypothetical protein